MRGVYTYPRHICDRDGAVLVTVREHVLRSANLRGANLQGANLINTELDSNRRLTPISTEEIKAAGLEVSGPYVFGYRTETCFSSARTKYIPGRCYVAPILSACCKTSCHPGIYFADKEYLRCSYGDVSLVRCFCRRDELVHAGVKWRCRRLWVVPDGWELTQKGGKKCKYTKR